jgi:hypothetical protein
MLSGVRNVTYDRLYRFPGRGILGTSGSERDILRTDSLEAPHFTLTAYALKAMAPDFKELLSTFNPRGVKYLIVGAMR